LFEEAAMTSAENGPLPVEDDPALPRIAPYDPHADPDWPIGWGFEMTERDAAVQDDGQGRHERSEVT
jgi:hypothetical protein